MTTSPATSSRRTSSTPSASPRSGTSSTSIARDGEDLIVEGELTLKGTTKPLQLKGSLIGPVVGLSGGEAIGVELEGSIDRTEYGLNWNAPLPTGGFAVGNEVKLTAHLELGKA